MHIQGASSVFVQDYEDSIWSALDDLGRRKGPVGYATLTLNFAYDGEPAHELKVRNIVNHAPPENGWDVNIRAKVIWEDVCCSGTCPGHLLYRLS